MVMPSSRMLSAAAPPGDATDTSPGSSPPAAPLPSPVRITESIVPQRPPKRARAARSAAASVAKQAAPRVEATPAAGPGHPPFEAEAARVLTALSSALGLLIRSLPTPVDGCRELERVLGIDHVLAWRAYRVATAPDPAAVGADVPRPAPMDRLLRAARRRRVSAEVVQGVREAYADFQEMVRRHAGEDPRGGPGAGERGGGRAAFDALICGGRGESAPPLGQKHRRAA